MSFYYINVEIVRKCGNVKKILLWKKIYKFSQGVSPTSCRSDRKIKREKKISRQFFSNLNFFTSPAYEFLLHKCRTIGNNSKKYTSPSDKFLLYPVGAIVKGKKMYKSS